MEGRGGGGEGVVGAKMFPQEISRTKESSVEVSRSLNTRITKCPTFPFIVPLHGRNSHQCSLKQEVAKDVTEALTNLL